VREKVSKPFLHLKPQLGQGNLAKLSPHDLVKKKHRVKVVNVHEAKTHLSRLLEGVAKGEPFVIAKAGKPVARVVPLDSPVPETRRRLGFLSGHIRVPDDFDRMGAGEIEALFGVADQR
jgi:prevent-host-death family protein